MWEINKKVQSLEEHKGPLTSIKVKSNDKECVSASADGTCIIWDLIRFVRNQVNYRINRFMRSVPTKVPFSGKSVVSFIPINRNFNSW